MDLRRPSAHRQAITVCHRVQGEHQHVWRTSAARLAARFVDCVRPGVDVDEMRTAPYVPSQSGRRFFLAVDAAEDPAVESWDALGAYMPSPADP
jgi:hypothetical protein